LRCRYAPSCGFHALSRKAPDELTLDDACDACCAMAAVNSYFHFGCASIVALEVRGIHCVLRSSLPINGPGWPTTMQGCVYADEGNLMAEHIGAVSLERFPSSEAIARLLHLMLQLLREEPRQMRPARHGEVWEAALWISVCIYTHSRPGVSQSLLANGGILSFGMHALEQRWDPMARITIDAWVPGVIMSTLKEVCLLGILAEEVEVAGNAATLLQQIIDAGMPQMLRSVLRAYTLLGESAQEKASVMAVWFGTLWFLAELDLQDPVNAPVVNALRTEGDSFRFVLDHPLTQLASMGLDSATHATMICANLFGRDEENSFSFSQKELDTVLVCCQERLCPTSWGHIWPCNARSNRVMLSLCISDAHKQQLLNNPQFLPHLVAGLLFDVQTASVMARPDFDGVKGAVQLLYAECLQQLSLFEPAQRAMRVVPSVMDALRQLVTSGWTTEAKVCAHRALLALEERPVSRAFPSCAQSILTDIYLCRACDCRISKLRMESPGQDPLRLRPSPIGGGIAQLTAAAAAGEDGEPAPHIEHIMLSYNWDHQAVIKRVHASLVRHGYTTWIDVERMQGSTVEAMADAVEGAVVMCYGVSRAYKESANCRLEAQYAYQREKDMVPLMLEEGYRADGWLGMFMGTRLWYGFLGSVLASEVAFEGKVEELCRELGERGKGDRGVKSTTSVPPEGVPSRLAVEQQQQQQATSSPIDKTIASSGEQEVPPQQLFSPSILQTDSVSTLGLVDGGGSSGTGLATMELVLGQQRLLLEWEDRRRVELAQQQQREARDDDGEKELILSTQLADFEARLDAMHVAQLLSDEELYALEDACADFLVLRSATAMVLTPTLVHAVSEYGVVAKLAKMIGISEGIASDARCARQLRRIFI
jgi:hypothetical protein